MKIRELKGVVLTLGFLNTSAAFSAPSPAPAAPKGVPAKSLRVPGVRFAPGFRTLIDDKDYLGARIYLRKNFSKLSHPDDWVDLRNALIDDVDHVGFDLVYAWDKRPPGKFVNSGILNINESRFEADNLVIAGRFQEAFDLFQKIAVELRRLKKSSTSLPQIKAIDLLYPYILQSMGRALYGAGRYDDAYVVLRWIPKDFPKFRQVQFEKMWAAFRGNRYDHALGAIASQKSSFFSLYMAPESYLVQTYLYKRLCRDDDYNQVVSAMRAFRDKLASNTYTVEDWASSELETRILWVLANSKPKTSPLVSAIDRQNEQTRIQGVLANAHASYRARLLEELEKSLAYVQLTVRSGSGGALPPIEKLPDRQTIFKMGLEIWPADSSEDWVDEMGAHRFIGESLCANAAK